MTILAAAWLSKAMADTSSSFNYLDCVSYNTPSDRAMTACESVVRGGGSLSGFQLDNLARYICIRTIPCTMGVSLESIAECKLPESSTPDQDRACRTAFLGGTNLTVSTVDRSDKLSNCEQDIGQACGRYSNFRTYTKVLDLESDQLKTSWTLTTFRNETGRKLDAHAGSLTDISAQMTRQENEAQLMLKRLEAIENAVSWHWLVFYTVVAFIIGQVVVQLFKAYMVVAFAHSAPPVLSNEDLDKRVVDLLRLPSLTNRYVERFVKTPAPVVAVAAPPVFGPAPSAPSRFRSRNVRQF
jgi:hypothetical protein